MDSPSLPGRLLAIDYGDRRVGLALSDPLGITAQGLPTLTVASEKAFLEALASLIREKEVTGLVLGYPRNMDDTVGPRARAMEILAERLRVALGLPVALWDERLTSWEADAVLKTARCPRDKRKGLRDRVAAQLILRGYLDHLRAGGT